MTRERDERDAEDRGPSPTQALPAVPVALQAGNQAVAHMARSLGTQPLHGMSPGAALDRLASAGTGGAVIARQHSPLGRLHEVELQLSEESTKTVGWIGDAVMKLIALKADLDKSIADGKPFMGDNTLDVASRVHQIAEALQKLGAGLTSAYSKVKDSESSIQTQTDIDKAVTQIGRIVNGLKTIQSAAQAQRALEEFQKKPGPETADAWADSVTGVFDSFGKVVGSLDLPPGLTWIADFYAGLLGAPKAYVTFFRATMRARYSKMNDEVGYSSYTHKLTQGEKTMWAGPSTSMVSEAWLFDYKLQEWIFAHPKVNGQKLWDLGVKDVAALLMTALEKDTTIDAATRTKWGGFLAKYL